MRVASDFEIACALYRGGLISGLQLEVWCRQNAGETIYRMRKDYHKVSGGSFHADTLYDWVHKVNKAIAESKMITADPRDPEKASPWGISIAQGSDVRVAANDTPQGRTGVDESTWNVERLQAAGVLDRYSRKRK